MREVRDLYFRPVDVHVFASGKPRRAEHLEHLQEHGITKIINLDDEPLELGYSERVAKYGMSVVHVPITKYQPPSPAQLLKIYGEIAASRRAGKNVLLHCDKSVGRTGAVVAAYLMLKGMSREQAEAESQMSQHNPAQLQFTKDFGAWLAKHPAQVARLRRVI